MISIDNYFNALIVCNDFRNVYGLCSECSWLKFYLWHVHLLLLPLGYTIHAMESIRRATVAPQAQKGPCYASSWTHLDTMRPQASLIRTSASMTSLLENAWLPCSAIRRLLRESSSSMTWNMSSPCLSTGLYFIRLFWLVPVFPLCAVKVISVH